MGALSSPDVTDAVQLSLVDLTTISTALGMLYRHIEDHPDEHPIRRGKQDELNNLRHRINCEIVVRWEEALKDTS